MSQRIQIVLPEPVGAQLQELAAGRDEPLARVASEMVRDGVALATYADGHRARSRSAAAARGKRRGDKRAAWLEPYGGESGWRAEMWGAIVALHGRYPKALGALKEKWWTDQAQTEILCALAAWRAEIDDTGVDPREELAFHGQLADYAETLRREGGGVTKTWRPGAPPEGWAV